MTEHAIAPVTTDASGSGRRRVGSLVAGGAIAVFAVVFVTSGLWALWVDRVDRGSGGFVKIGSTTLNTPTYAIEAPLTGDGPHWLYGATVFGTGRVRATSQTAHPMFVGIARTSDVARYLDGTGYATIQHLASDQLTTHQGGAPAGPPAQRSIWAASTQGNGQQTLLWKPRGGDWSIVMMNTDATPGVSLRGDLAAKLPALPWIAGGLLLAGAALATLGIWLILRGIRGKRPTAQLAAAPVPGVSPSQVSVGAPS
jgi:hypothetical protein